jgi:hypothetical protein
METKGLSDEFKVRLKDQSQDFDLLEQARVRISQLDENLAISSITLSDDLCINEVVFTAKDKPEGE